MSTSRDITRTVPAVVRLFQRNRDRIDVPVPYRTAHGTNAMKEEEDIISSILSNFVFKRCHAINDSVESET